MLSSTNATSVNVATGSATINASTSYYIDDAGSNSNSGTSSGSPFLTLSHALSQATCGYTINVAAGTYTDDLLDVTSTHDGLTIAGATVRNEISTSLKENIDFPDHIKRILDFYKVYK